jgi:hypothetical protein
MPLRPGLAHAQKRDPRRPLLGVVKHTESGLAAVASRRSIAKVIRLIASIAETQSCSRTVARAQGDRFVERFSRHVQLVRGVVQIVDSDGAGFGSHE